MIDFILVMMKFILKMIVFVYEMLQSFIEEWVMCMGCGLPECNLEVEEERKGEGSAAGGRIMLACSACGHQGEQRSGVMSKQIKLVRYMRAHPPKIKVRKLCCIKNEKICIKNEKCCI